MRPEKWYQRLFLWWLDRIEDQARRMGGNERER